MQSSIAKHQRPLTRDYSAPFRLNRRRVKAAAAHSECGPASQDEELGESRAA
jgi:hypothetical protein